LLQYYFYNQQITKLPKIELPIGKELKDKFTLTERDLCIAKMYAY